MYRLPCMRNQLVRKMIREAKIPVIAIKPLASGDSVQKDYILFNNIKPQDAFLIGVLSPGEVEEDVKSH